MAQGRRVKSSFTSSRAATPWACRGTCDFWPMSSSAASRRRATAHRPGDGGRSPRPPAAARRRGPRASGCGPRIFSPPDGNRGPGPDRRVDRPALPRTLVRDEDRRDGGVPRAAGSRGAFLGRPAHSPRRADVCGRRAPLRLLRVRHALLRQRRDAPRGAPEAVLLRAGEAPEAAPPRLLSGPAKLCTALGITTRDSGRDLLGDGPMRIFRRPGRRPRIAVSRRVGVDYAGEAAQWPLRFFDAASPAVSRR